MRLPLGVAAGVFALPALLFVPLARAQPAAAPPSVRAGSPAVTAVPVLAQHRLPINGAQTDDPLAGLSQLDAHQLAAIVVARHPSVESALAAWRAAAARYPQAVSLNDPMVDLMMAPGSIGSPNVDFAYIVQGRQQIPWSGKRQLRGNVASAEARAVYQDVNEARLRLALAAKQAFYEYSAATSLRALSDLNGQALESFRQSAVARYRANQVSQQDVLQAEVELAQVKRRQIELNRAARVAAARINTFALRYVDAPLPVATPLGQVEPLPPAELLRQYGIASRPDLAQRATRVRAEQWSVALANREFRPDLEWVGRYDTFWQGTDRPLQGQMGLSLNVPLAQDRRRAAVREANARMTRERAELDAMTRQAEFEIQEAYEQVFESLQTTALYNHDILPAAKRNVQSAQAGYTAGQVDFLRLIQAQRELIELSEQAIQAQAELHSRLAMLERVVGGTLPRFQAEQIRAPAPTDAHN